MKIVEILQPYAPYATGDITRFESEIAAELIKSGVAKEYKEKKKVSEDDSDKEVDTEVKSIDNAPKNKMVNNAPNKK